MAETTADVKRDIELTRERMSSTLAQLERKMNLTQIVKDNPWPALGLAVGAGLLLSGTRADVKAAAATAVATRGASSKMGTALDDIVSHLMRGLGEAVQGHVDGLVDQVKEVIGMPKDGADGKPSFASYSGARSDGVDGAAKLADTDTHPTSGAGSWAPQSSGDMGTSAAGASGNTALGRAD